MNRLGWLSNNSSAPFKPNTPDNGKPIECIYSEVIYAYIRI